MLRQTTIPNILKWIIACNFLLFSSFTSAQYIPYPMQMPYPYQQNPYQIPFQQNLQAYQKNLPGYQQNLLPGYKQGLQSYQQNLPTYKQNLQSYQQNLPTYQQNPFPVFPQFQQFPAYPQLPQYPFFPVAKPGVIDIPAASYNDTNLSSAIPVEIIDVDENENVINPTPGDIIDVNEIKPDVTTSPNSEEEQDETTVPTTPEKSTIHPLISGTSFQHYSSNINNTKGIQIFENKPINTVIRRTIYSNGKDGRNVLNIHVVNGVEVTSMGTPSVVIYEEGVTEKVRITTEKDESEEDEDKDENAVVDDADPKPVLGWLI